MALHADELFLSQRIPTVEQKLISRESASVTGDIENISPVARNRIDLDV